MISRGYSSRLMALVIFILSNSANGAEPLLWKFVEGDSYNYQMIQDMKSDRKSVV